MIWSCTIFQLNLACQRIIGNLLTSRGTYVYDTWQKDDGTEEEMKIYIDDVKDSFLGTTIELQLDKKNKAQYVRDGKVPQFRVTVSMAVHLFKQQGWPLLAGVFAQNQNALDLRAALADIYKDNTGKNDNPLYKVLFLLREREEELLRCFPNMKRLRVQGIQGSHIRDATISGDALEESAEYQKWVKNEDFRGKISYVGIPVGKEVITLSNHGFMHSKHGKEPRPISIVYDVIKGLINCRTLVYEPTLDLFQDKLG